MLNFRLQAVIGVLAKKFVNLEHKLGIYVKQGYT